LERIELPDGRRFVAKHLPAEGDWLTRATGGRDRLRRLWETGLLERVGDVADHTIVDIHSVDDHDVVVMRDAGEELLPPSTPVARATSRLLLTGLARLHEHFRGIEANDLCAPAARYAMFAPDFHATDAPAGRHPMADRIVRGWTIFADQVAADVVDAVFGVHRDPSVLGSELVARPGTLLHGDVKLENLGLSSDQRLVTIDWGELTGVGPREIDVAWYALKSAGRVRCTPDEIFADYDDVSPEPMDAAVLDLVCIGSLAQMGFRFALSAYDVGPEPAASARALLDWWTDRVRAALERI
jgi:hypothetical protein